MMNSSLALLLLVTTLSDRNVWQVTACPYLEGESARALKESVGGIDAGHLGASNVTEPTTTTTYTRGGVSSRQLQSRSKLGDRIRKFWNRIRGKRPAAAPSAPVPTAASAPVAPPKTSPVAPPKIPPVATTPAVAPVAAPVVPPALTPAKAAPMAVAPAVAPMTSPVAAPAPSPQAAPVSAPTPVAAPMAPVAAPAQTVAQVIAAARSEIVATINAQPTSSAMAAKIVRLSFHDCVGGCDGCVDMSNLDNTGLDIPINTLQPIVTKYAQGANALLTRADVWALAGLTAAANAQVATSVSFPLTLVGRPTCANFPNGTEATRAGPARSMPSAHLTSSQLVDFFATNFGFTANETVAIMGAHTLYVLHMLVLGVDLSLRLPLTFLLVAHCLASAVVPCLKIQVSTAMQVGVQI
jgi:Peroxidase